MISDVKSKEDLSKFAENKVSFITFNYDRSFEHYLYESLRHSFYEVGESEIQRAMAGLKVFHVYGQVAWLPWQRTDGMKIEYGKIDGNMWGLRNNIKVIGEERGELDTRLKQGLIRNAKKVFFLGFGFSTENLDILKMSDILHEDHKVFGSAIGFLKEELQSLKYWQLSGGPNGDGVGRIVLEEKTNCRDILRKYLYGSDEP